MKKLCVSSLMISFVSGCVLSAGLTACDGASTYVHKDFPVSEEVKQRQEATAPKDMPVSLVGEKFFRENRFSQYFFANSKGFLNQLPAQGDPVVETLESLTKNYANPYQGQAISCAACHFVDQMKDISGLGVRAYNDFSRRSRVPDRGDGQERTVRNSPNMVGTAIKDGMFLHSDGEFSNPADLTRASFIGRNMGWLANESQQAIHHIAEVVRNDTGDYVTDTDLAGLSYKNLFAGSPEIPAEFLIPADYRLDVKTASDEQIFNGVIRLVTEYLRALDYNRDADGNYQGSPYDAFLKKNNLPLAPAADESAADYSTRLGALVAQAKNLVFVGPSDGELKLHQQSFSFSEKELAGLKVFFGNGQCVQCHSAPDFTDHLFHNTGVSQEDYDRTHGAGRFMSLSVPRLEERNAQAELYLPPSEQFPRAQSLFRSAPTLNDLRRADLGVWTIFANPAVPLPQGALRTAICKSLNLTCSLMSDEEILDRSLGLVRTPSIRDLGQSAPYTHTGQADRIEDVIQLYLKDSVLARKGQVRNGDPRLKEIQLSQEDMQNLASFLRSLNEDYE